jgi:hypothetical protein
MTEAGRYYRLEGLEGSNLLGFLALLGVLRALEAEQPAWRPRAYWDVKKPPLRPSLRLNVGQSDEAICEAAAKGVERLAAFIDFADANDLKLDVGKAKTLCQSSAAQLKGGEHEQTEPGERFFADLCAALFSNAVKDDEKGTVEPTFLAYPSVATSNFLKNFKAIAKSGLPDNRPRDPFYPKSAADCLSQALFQPWNRSDRPVKGSGLRWDPDEAKRHALQWRAPTKDPPTMQHGAYRLAIIGLSALTAAPVTSGTRVTLSVLGGTGLGDRFSLAWPIWTKPISLAAIRALLSHPELRKPGALDYLGVDHVRVTRRISLDRLRNFTAAEPLEQEESI